ncbi:hypothetical protein JW859_06015 [bacterium]|nr:hypothetical protein [bacterium]
MNKNITHILLGLLLAIVVLAPVWAEDDARPVSAKPLLTRIGVVPLHDAGNLRDGAEQMTEILLGRLAARFADVEFLAIDPAEAGLEDKPLLLADAVTLGEACDVEALIDGTFDGIEIVGGTWPNQGADTPQARGFLRWRLVDCQDGLLLADGRIRPAKPEFYSRHIRTEEALVRRVMQSLADQVGAEIEDLELLAGTEAPEETPAAKETSTQEG